MDAKMQRKYLRECMQYVKISKIAESLGIDHGNLSKFIKGGDTLSTQKADELIKKTKAILATIV